MDPVIRGSALTTFDLSPDGSQVRFNVRDENGVSGALELPASCLSQMLMTLPLIIQQALRRSQRDNTLKLVYPLGEFRLEAGEADEHGVRRYILTMQAEPPFEISFSATSLQLGTIAQSVIDQVLATEQGVLEPVELNS